MTSFLVRVVVSIHSAGLPAEKQLADRIAAVPEYCRFQSTPLVFQRRNSHSRFWRAQTRCFNPLRWSSSGETPQALRYSASAVVSIHSAGLPAEKRERGRTQVRPLAVSIHSAGLPAEKRAGALALAQHDEFQSTPLVFQRRNVSLVGVEDRPEDVSIHSAGLPAEKPIHPRKGGERMRVSIHSAGLPAEKRFTYARGRSRFTFQSTPLVFQRRNTAPSRRIGREECFNPLRWSSSGETSYARSASARTRCFNPLRWSSSGETAAGGCLRSRAPVSIHSAGLPAEKPRAR